VTYKTIVADPPWAYRDSNRDSTTLIRTVKSDGGIARGVASLGYETLDPTQIAALSVASVADRNAHLYLWTTNAFLEQAHAVARAWGFAPKTLITWVKVKADGTPSMKTGYWFRGATEHVLFAVRGSLRLAGNAAVPTVFFQRRLPHSVKPDAFYALVESVSPGPRLEMFARGSRAGWHTWGDQCPRDIDL
jgi:N6-adenosine-specific RNA methylase IME4